jgi:Uma2 family endonuclease
MVKPPKSVQAFKEALLKEKINLVVRENHNGIIYGMTYIDHKTKCVFNGSDIGKEYSAKPILEKCGVTQTFPLQEKIFIKKEKPTIQMQELKLSPNTHHDDKKDLSNVLEVLMTPVEENNNTPYELRKQKKKKRKSH